MKRDSMSAPLLLLASTLFLLLQLHAPLGVQGSRIGPISISAKRSLLQGPVNDIKMAPADVLKASVFAARLSELAYPGSVLTSDDDVIASYTDPAKFQLYANGLTAVTRNLTTFDLTFVQRLSASVLNPSTSARYLYAFIMPTSTAVYVAFRGTDLTGDTNFPVPSTNSFISAGVDANTLQTQFFEAPGANVHSGFYLSLTDGVVDSYDSNSYPNGIAAYDEIKAGITAAFKTIGQKVPVVLTGHSLGAAQATLCAFLLKQDGFDSISLYTFGDPQIGDQAWRDAFDAALGSSHYRWWNMQDPVAQVPNSEVDPGCFDDRLNRVCTQNWFTVDSLYRIDTLEDGSLRCGIPSGKFAVCDMRNTSTPPLNEQSCYISIDSTLKAIETAMEAADHKISAYMSHLESCLEAAE